MPSLGFISSLRWKADIVSTGNKHKDEEKARSLRNIRTAKSTSGSCSSWPPSAEQVPLQKKGRGTRLCKTPLMLFQMPAMSGGRRKKRLLRKNDENLFDQGESTASFSSLSLRDSSSAQFSSVAFQGSMVRCPTSNITPVDEGDNEDGGEDDESESTCTCITPPSAATASTIAESDGETASTRSPPLSTTTSVPRGYKISKNQNQELGYLSFQFSNNPSDHGEYHNGIDEDSQLRILEEALEFSRQEGPLSSKKPVLCLRTCHRGRGCSCANRHVGKEVFSHPLIVEAAETLFVTAHLLHASSSAPASSASTSAPKCDHASSTATTLDLLDGESGARLVPTLTLETMNRATVVQAMIQALDLLQQPVPRYLQLLQEEEVGRLVSVEGSPGAGGTAMITSTSVFGITKLEKDEEELLEADADFAGLDGVLATKAGYINRQPVVEVTFDSKRLSFSCLVRHAFQRCQISTVYYRSNDERIAAQVEMERVQGTSAKLQRLDCTTIQPCYNPKQALRETPMRFVPLTDLQATRANRFVQLGRFDEAMHLLSPRQGMILMNAMQKNSAQRAFHEVIDVPILPAWISVCEEQHPEITTESLKRTEESEQVEEESLSSIYEYDVCSFENRPPGFPWFDF